MELVRLLSHRHFDPRKARFNSLAFKNTGQEPGISVINSDCIRATGASICEHIKTYYSGLAGEPAIYWVFSSETLPDGHTLEQETSSTGDICHYNIRGVPDAVARQWFKGYSSDLSNFQVCTPNGSSRILQRDDIVD